MRLLSPTFSGKTVLLSPFCFEKSFVFYLTTSAPGAILFYNKGTFTL